MSHSLCCPNEQERLSALRRYDILDTPSEERFDRITRLAAHWFDVPIALIAFLDEDRLWFKSCYGLDRTEIDREGAFCPHLIRNQSHLVVEDASEDPRFADTPWVRGPVNLRFYAGVPLRAPGGEILGSLCVIDTTPRDATSTDVVVLRNLADIVTDELELHATTEKLRERTRQAQSLSRALTEAEKTERQRLSQLLHDDLQQLLHAARMKVELFCDNDRPHQKASEDVTDAVEKIKQATEITRSLSTRLSPSFDKKSLYQTFEWLAAKMQEHHDLSVSLQARTSTSVPDTDLKALLFRLVRELLFNVVKHAETDEAHIVLVQNEEHLYVVVEDDGKGFDPSEELQNGLGLANVQERIEILGGTVDIHSDPGEGTRIVVEVPVADCP